MKTFLERFEEKYIPEPNSGCWIWVGATSWSGYDDYRPYIFFNGGTRIAYRASYEYFKGKIPDGMQVCHTCDNGLCVNPDHLFCGTTQDNMDDSIKKGRRRYLIGDAHPQTKIKNADLPAVFELRAKGMKHREIAAIFGVKRKSIGNILNGERRTT